MDDNTKLRQLETRYKLRVRTGCETCRVRKVKCDETKPACLRCTRTGRECKGYDRLDKAKKGKPAAAASFRNADFLVVPQRVQYKNSPNSLIQSFSENPLENRAFQYFQTHTLPSWTEFFDSELWSRKILQLCHLEPAIKHGLLALSVMHERFQEGSPVFTKHHDDFAFMQYAQAVKHSNKLLLTYSGQVEDLESVLLACIMFVCYENLAGNFRTANMHLKNGLQILRQHDQAASSRSKQSVESIAHVLARFDLQAMTFSDNSSVYEYKIDEAPACPEIPDFFQSNDVARNTLAAMLRCMMWISGMADIDSEAPHNFVWQKMCAEILVAFKKWELKFDDYQRNIPLKDRRNPKTYAGNTLLKMGAVVMRIFEGAAVGVFTEMAWDAFMEDFKTIVDLAETLSSINPALSQPSSGRTSQSTAPPTPATRQDFPASTKDRPIAPNSTNAAPSLATGPSTSVFAQDPMSSLPAASRPSPPSTPPAKDSELYSQIAYFSPSFEFSPIVPLFVVSARCRDPVLRRRAIAFLLSSRRREGCWDSFGAGMCALQAMKYEEGLPRSMAMESNGERTGIWNMNPDIRGPEDIPEERRVRNIFISVKAAEGKIETGYQLTTGEMLSETVIFEKQMVRSKSSAVDEKRGSGLSYQDFWSKSWS